MTINFPNNPGYGEGETSSYTYSSDGIVQSWYWGETGDNPVEAWIPLYSGVIGEGAAGSQGFQGFQGFFGITGTQGFQGNIGITGTQGFQGNIGITGTQGFQGNIGITGTQGFQGPPSSEGNSTPQGPEGSVQFADSGSLSGISEVGVFANENLIPVSGLSANFLQYTESLSSDTNIKNTDETKNISFGSYNILTIPNIALSENQTLKIEGLSPNTGSSLTIILGHTGATGSKITISNMGIYWSDGPLNGGLTEGLGYTAYIYPNPTVKKFDVLYFFSDGNHIFGNHQRNYLQYK